LMMMMMIMMIMMMMIRLGVILKLKLPKFNPKLAAKCYKYLQ
jgi:hypothetical protein